MPKPSRTAAALCLAVLLAGPASALAQSPAERGRAIMEEADRRDTGWGDLQVGLEMILTNKEGESARRVMRMNILERTEDGDMSVIVFDHPRDIDGTALLTHSHKVGDDDQWLYLPTVKRSKRISGANKSGSFVGSEFSYEDLTSQEVEKYTYAFLREEACGEVECFVLDRFPVDEDSGYTRQTVWVDKAEYRLQRIAFFDRKDAHLKSLEFEDYRRYLDRYWRALTLRMTNHQTGKGTDLVFEDYRFGTGLDDGDFRKNSLSRL